MAPANESRGRRPRISRRKLERRPQPRDTVRTDLPSVSRDAHGITDDDAEEDEGKKAKGHNTHSPGHLYLKRRGKSGKTAKILEKDTLGSVCSCCYSLRSGMLASYLLFFLLRKCSSTGADIDINTIITTTTRRGSVMFKISITILKMNMNEFGIYNSKP
jgi:hypothetical protein